MWASPGPSDQRAAWTGAIPGTDLPLRIEAAGWLGKPVFFLQVEPWTKPPEAQMLTSAQKARVTMLIFLGVITFIIPGLLAWRNIKRGKADRRGAFRLAVGIFCAYFPAVDSARTFPPGFGVFALFVLALATSLFNGALVWTLYLALEPYVRRHWPQTIISWSRLVDGKLRDPAVGRDMLFGLVVGVSWTLLIVVAGVIGNAMGDLPEFDDTSYLLSPRSALGAWTSHLPASVTGTLMFFFLLFILRVLLRNKWLAAAAFVALWTTVQSLGNTHPWTVVPVFIALYSIAALSVVRYGLVALATAVFVADTLGGAPIALNPSAWYFGSTVLVMGPVILLAGWSFYAATAGRRLFTGELLE